MTKVFGDVKALNGVSLRVDRGEAVAVLGPNGAGKTTAISLMLGLRSPTTGRAALFGRDPRDLASRRRVGVMLQESGMPATIKVREAIELFRRLYPAPLSISSALEAANLESKANARIGNLSGGQRQRLYFALAIVGDPDVLFLDEPTVGLDVESRRSFWEQVAAMLRRGKTLVLTTHYLDEADALANRIVVIDHGEVVAEGSPSAIKRRVGGKKVRFRNLQSPGPNDAYFLGLPGVERISRSAEGLELFAREPEAALARIFADDVAIGDLEVVGAGLEEAFITLTGGKGV
ncbi:MAG TPA: ABC transporter ATP-binding protein [Chloroflexota bacterium]|nr:ABC transporter ATP-binding protein [Chloroflexota bacterium]